MNIFNIVNHAIQYGPAILKIGHAASDVFNKKSSETFEDRVERINGDQIKYKGLIVHSDGDVLSISYKYKRFKFIVEYDD